MFPLPTHAQAPFNQGDWVFEQGDDGDAFFVIIEGQALVLRTEGADDEEDTVLAELSDGAFFGERALLKNGKRFAGIRATSNTLHTMSITRAAFEAVLGKLENLVPDRY